jgi:hypothetical protein
MQLRSESRDRGRLHQLSWSTLLDMPIIAWDHFCTANSDMPSRPEPLIGRTVEREAVVGVCASLVIEAECLSLDTGLYLTCRFRAHRLMINDVEFYSHTTVYNGAFCR